jgi:hypothetical protein
VYGTSVRRRMFCEYKDYHRGEAEWRRLYVEGKMKMF